MRKSFHAWHCHLFYYHTIVGLGNQKSKWRILNFKTTSIPTHISPSSSMLRRASRKSQQCTSSTCLPALTWATHCGQGESVYLACYGAGPALPHPEGVYWFLASPARIGIFEKWSCVLSCLCLTDVCTQWGSTNSFRTNKSVKKVYQLLPME